MLWNIDYKIKNNEWTNRAGSVHTDPECLDVKFPYFNSNYSLAAGKLIAFKFKSLTMSKMKEINRKRVLLHTEE